MRKKQKNNSGKIGAVLGGAAGAISTVMSNPIGRWTIFNAQDEAGLKVLRTVEHMFHNEQMANTAYRLFNLVTNTIMAYPAVLPIAGGLLAAGIGALVSKKITNSKLKHKSLKTVKMTKGYSR